jgi:hypothetical protein
LLGVVIVVAIVVAVLIGDCFGRRSV